MKQGTFSLWFLTLAGKIFFSILAIVVFSRREWKRFPSLSQEKKKLNKVHGKVKNEGEFSYKESSPFLFEKNIKNFSRERVGIFHILWNNIL